MFLFLSLFTYISNFFTHLTLSIHPSLRLYLYPTYYPYPLLLPCLHLHFFPHFRLKIYTYICLLLTPYFSPCNIPLPIPLLYRHIFNISPLYPHYITIRLPLTHHIFPPLYIKFYLYPLPLPLSLGLPLPLPLPLTIPYLLRPRYSHLNLPHYQFHQNHRSQIIQWISDLMSIFRLFAVKLWKIRGKVKWRDGEIYCYRAMVKLIW